MGVLLFFFAFYYIYFKMKTSIFFGVFFHDFFMVDRGFMQANLSIPNFKKLIDQKVRGRSPSNFSSEFLIRRAFNWFLTDRYRSINKEVIDVYGNFHARAHMCIRFFFFEICVLHIYIVKLVYLDKISFHMVFEWPKSVQD